MARIHEKIVFQDQIKYVISSAQPFYDMIKTGLNTKYGVVSGNELLHSTTFLYGSLVTMRDSSCLIPGIETRNSEKCFLGH